MRIAFTRDGAPLKQSAPGFEAIEIDVRTNLREAYLDHLLTWKLTWCGRTVVGGRFTEPALSSSLLTLDISLFWKVMCVLRPMTLSAQVGDCLAELKITTPWVTGTALFLAALGLVPMFQLVALSDSLVQIKDLFTKVAGLAVVLLPALAAWATVFWKWFREQFFAYLLLVAALWSFTWLTTTRFLIVHNTTPASLVLTRAQEKDTTVPPGDRSIVWVDGDGGAPLPDPRYEPVNAAAVPGGFLDLIRAHVPPWGLEHKYYGCGPTEYKVSVPGRSPWPCRRRLDDSCRETGISGCEVPVDLVDHGHDAGAADAAAQVASEQIWLHTQRSPHPREVAISSLSPEEALLSFEGSAREIVSARTAIRTDQTIRALWNDGDDDLRGVLLNDDLTIPEPPAPAGCPAAHGEFWCRRGTHQEVHVSGAWAIGLHEVEVQYARPSLTAETAVDTRFRACNPGLAAQQLVLCAPAAQDDVKVYLHLAEDFRVQMGWFVSLRSSAKSVSVRISQRSGDVGELVCNPPAQTTAGSERVLRIFPIEVTGLPTGTPVMSATVTVDRRMGKEHFKAIGRWAAAARLANNWVWACSTGPATQSRGADADTALGEASLENPAGSAEYQDGVLRFRPKPQQHCYFKAYDLSRTGQLGSGPVPPPGGARVRHAGKCYSCNTPHPSENIQDVELRARCPGNAFLCDQVACDGSEGR